MDVKELGSTGVMVPEIGLGTWNYNGAPAPLQRGIELGAFLIDTAEMYLNEEAIGRAIKGWRDRVFLAGKVLGSNLRYDQVMRAAETSLRRLAVDCMDLYQIHWCNPGVPHQRDYASDGGAGGVGLGKACRRQQLLPPAATRGPSRHAQCAHSVQPSALQP